ncbi:hypothetical protein CBL_20259, partial [Carabus blaptoides fortunei]
NGYPCKSFASASYVRGRAGNCWERVYPRFAEPTPVPWGPASALPVPEYTDGLELARGDTDSDLRVQYVLPDQGPKGLVPGYTLQLPRRQSRLTSAPARALPVGYSANRS